MNQGHNFFLLHLSPVRLRNIVFLESVSLHIKKNTPKKPTITTEELIQLINEQEVQLIDVRPADVYNAWLLGWPKISLFDGGWFEWSNDPENPIETGIPL